MKLIKLKRESIITKNGIVWSFYYRNFIQVRIGEDTFRELTAINLLRLIKWKI